MANYRVALDAGHGKNTAGKRSFDESFFEYEFNRDMAKRIKPILEEYGIEVLLTAPDDEDISLTARCKKSDAFGSDILVSLHANAYGTDWNSAHGMEVWYSDGSTKGLALAQCLHDALDKLGLTDRGVKATTEFTMCLRPKAPSIIVEHFFYTNHSELEMCNADEFREKFAVADAKGIITYLGMEWQKENKSESESEDEEMVRYEKLEDIPNNYGFRDVIETLMDAKIINGDGSDKTGNEDVIDLSQDQVRSLVFEYRGGAFDRKLKAEGLEPAVSD